MRRYTLGLLLGLVAVACSSFNGVDSPDTPSSSGGDGTADGGRDAVVTGEPQYFSLSIAPVRDTQTIIQGKDTTVPLVLTRGRELTGPVTIKITGFTNGVTSAPLTIEGTTGSLVLSSPTGPQGDAQGMIEATVETHAATTSLKLFVRGAPGALDTTWGNGGHVLAYTEAKGNATSDLLLGKNDDVYSLSGSVGGGSVNDHVVHLDKAGVLDSTYGTAGVASVMSFGPTAAALGADGRFVFVGNGIAPQGGGGGAGSAMNFAGLSPDGKTTEFNQATSSPPDGALDGRAAGAYAVTVRGSDGHIFMGFDNADINTGVVACGMTHVDAQGAAVVQFGVGGSERNTVSYPVGMLIQAGGALAVLSAGANVVDYVRYNAGTGAVLNATPKTVSIPGVHRSFRGAAGLVALSDESIIAPFNGTAGLYLLKLDVNGDPVASFGTGGLQGPYVIGGAAVAMGITVDADGKILVALDTGGIIRFTPAGDLDTAFGAGGLAPTESSTTSLHRRVVVQKQGGRILASGFGASQSEVTISAYWP